MSNPEHQLSSDDRKWLRWGYLVLGGLLLYRLVYLASGWIELSEDEAYQWVWSRHLAWSYYSKPPMIAYTQFLGTAIWGNNDFGVRFFSPVISAIIGWICLRFFAREVSARLGFALVLISNATALLFAGSTLMTVDPLNVLFWTAAMLAGWRAIQPAGTTRDWLWVGLWMGLGFLSKYTELFQWLCFAVFFALWKPARIHLRRPGPYLALLINGILALPVLIWNAQHDWVTITHVGGRADFGNTFRFTTRYLIEFLGNEAGLLNPVFFIGILWAAFAFWRAKPRDPRMIYFFSMSAPLFLAYLLQSFHAHVLPNWIAPAVVPFLCLMVLYWDAYRRWSVVRGAFYTGLILGLLAMIVLTNTDLIKTVTGQYLPASRDPLNRVRGWRDTARIAGEARQQLLKEGKPVFIICQDYGFTGEVTFYLPEAQAAAAGQPIVCCWGTDRPINQFYFWPEYHYRQRLGDNAIFVQHVRLVSGTSDPKPVSDSPPEALTRQFRSVKSLGIFHGDYHGRPIRWFQLFECRDQLPDQ